MTITAAMRVQLQQESIDNSSYLIDCYKNKFKKVVNNLRCQSGRIPNPYPNSTAGATIMVTHLLFGAKSQMFLLAAWNLPRYYERATRYITTSNTHWYPETKKFENQRKALSNRIYDKVEIPKILKMLSIIKLMENFADFLNRRIGSRTIPLSNVTREWVTVPAADHPLATKLPHSTEHGLVG